MAECGTASAAGCHQADVQRGHPLLTGLIFGLAPPWYSLRTAPASGLRQAGRGGDTRSWRLFGKGLVCAQVALSILMVSGAAVFPRHLLRLRNFDLGFRSDHVLLVALDPVQSGYTGEQLASRYRELLARMEAIPQGQLHTGFSLRRVAGSQDPDHPATGSNCLANQAQTSVNRVIDEAPGTARGPVSFVPAKNLEHFFSA